MAMTTCSECGGSISDRATVCPHCGAGRSLSPQTPFEKGVGYAGGVVLLLVFGFVLFCAVNMMG